jgi:hypothetical protein
MKTGENMSVVRFSTALKKAILDGKIPDDEVFDFIVIEGSNERIIQKTGREIKEHIRTGEITLQP